MPERLEALMHSWATPAADAAQESGDPARSASASGSRHVLAHPSQGRARGLSFRGVEKKRRLPGLGDRWTAVAHLTYAAPGMCLYRHMVVYVCTR